MKDEGDVNWALGLILALIALTFFLSGRDLARIRSLEVRVWQLESVSQQEGASLK